ncbi:hypothetical protein VTK56DRAFT_6177 [Thermocarpiscus australiensis]
MILVEIIATGLLLVCIAAAVKKTFCFGPSGGFALMVGKFEPSSTFSCRTAAQNTHTRTHSHYRRHGHMGGMSTAQIRTEMTHGRGRARQPDRRQAGIDAAPVHSSRAASSSRRCGPWRYKVITPTTSTPATGTTARRSRASRSSRRPAPAGWAISP